MYPQTDVSTGADWGDDGNFIAFLDHILARPIIRLGDIDIIEVDSHEARGEDLVLDALVPLFQRVKQLGQGKGSRQGLEFLRREGARTCEIEDVELTFWWARDRTHRIFIFIF